MSPHGHDQHQHDRHDDGHGGGHSHGAMPSIRRTCDVLVMGGSAGGLGAALQLARSGRSVIAIDAGEPRNASAGHLHGFLTRDGTPPAELLDLARAEVRSYGVEVLPGRVVAVTGSVGDGFVAELTGGHRIAARRVVVASGIVDELPDIPGVDEHWGRDVLHCPFCHGFEVRGRRVVQIASHPLSLHVAPLFRHLTPHLTVVLHGDQDESSPEVEALRSGGVAVVAGHARAVLAGDDGRVARVELTDGTLLDADAVVVSPTFRPRCEALAPLGLSSVPHASGLGEHLAVDPRGETAVVGVYATGNVTDPSQQVAMAAADGARVGAMVAFDLASEDLAAASRPSGREADWDERYGGERVWSGNPNGSLVAEVADLAPGTALDVGAGEGGDAVWLAERGWRVTANDISGRALARVAAEASQRGLEVDVLRADAGDLDAFDGRTFDLVSLQYASIHRSPDSRAVDNALAAVAPGGTLVVVSHDLTPMRTPVDTSVASRPFDPDAYVRVDDLAAAIAADPRWQVVVHETRPRPPGSATASHHVDDIVLRAVRVA